MAKPQVILQSAQQIWDEHLLKKSHAPAAGNPPLWMPVCYDAGQEIGGLWCSHTHYGAAVADKHEAWAEARRMCDECGGIGFTVSRVAPINKGVDAENTGRKSRRTTSSKQSSRGEA